MKQIKRHYKKMAVLLSLSLLSACFAPHTPYASAAKIKLNKSKLKLTAGKKYTLKLSKVKSKKVKWTSSKKKVATVSKKGVVKAKKAGKATITAKYKGKKYKCKVTVKKKNTKKPNTTSPGGSSQTPTQNPSVPVPTQNPGQTTTATPPPGQSTTAPGPGQNTPTPEPGQNTTAPNPTQTSGQGTAAPDLTPAPSSEPDETADPDETPRPARPHSLVTVQNNPEDATELEKNIVLEYQVLANSILVSVTNKNTVHTDEVTVYYSYVDDEDTSVADSFWNIPSIQPGEKVSFAIPVSRTEAMYIDESASTIYAKVTEADSETQYPDLSEEISVALNQESFNEADASISIDMFNHSRHTSSVSYTILCSDREGGKVLDACSDTIVLAPKESLSESVSLFTDEDTDLSLYKNFSIVYSTHTLVDIDPNQDYIDKIELTPVTHNRSVQIDVANKNDVWLDSVTLEYFLYDSEDNLLINEEPTLISMKPGEKQSIAITGTPEQISRINWNQSYANIKINEIADTTSMNYMDLTDDTEIRITQEPGTDGNTVPSVYLFNHSRYNTEVSYMVSCYDGENNLKDVCYGTASLSAKTSTSEPVTFLSGDQYDHFETVCLAHGTEEINPDQAYIDNITLSPSDKPLSDSKADALTYSRLITVKNGNGIWLSSATLEYFLYDSEDNFLMSEELPLLSMAPGEIQYVTVSGTREQIAAIDWDRSYVNIDVEVASDNDQYSSFAGNISIFPSTGSALPQNDNDYSFTIQNGGSKNAEVTYMVEFSDSSGKIIAVQYGTCQLNASESTNIILPGPDDPQTNADGETVYPAASAYVVIKTRHAVTKKTTGQTS